MPEDDFVHVDQAAKALGVSRRTVERMIERGHLDRDTRDHTPVAAVTKRSLVQMLDSRRDTNTTRQPRQTTSNAPDLAGVLRAVERLADSLHDERRQLLTTTEERDQVARERDEARLEVARLRGELEAHRELTDRVMTAASAVSEKDRSRLGQLIGSRPLQAPPWRRRLRVLVANAKAAVDSVRNIDR